MNIIQATQLAASVVAGNLGGAFPEVVGLAPGAGGTVVTGVAPAMRVATVVDSPPPSMTAIYAPAKALADVLAKLGKDAGMSVTRGVLTVSAGRASVKMAVLDQGLGFGDESDGELSTVDGADLLRALLAVIPAACRDLTREHIAGVGLEKDGGLAIATDGHRMHLASLPGAPSIATIPLAAAQAIARMIESAVGGPVKIRHTATDASFACGASKLRTPLVGAGFPPWRQVIPASNKHSLTVDSDAILGAIKTARMSRSVTTWDKAKGEPPITFEVSNGLMVIRSAEATEDACDVVGTMTRCHANPAYIVDAIATLGGGQVKIESSGELDPLVFSAGGERRIVMGVRG